MKRLHSHIETASPCCPPQDVAEPLPQHAIVLPGVLDTSPSAPVDARFCPDLSPGPIVISSDSSQGSQDLGPSPPSEDEGSHSSDSEGTWRRIAHALGVDLSVAPIETLAYTFICQAGRGESFRKDQLLELWDALPRKLVFKDKNTTEGYLSVFGVNPRNTAHMTNATLQLPNVYEVLRAFVKQCDPAFRFSCICIRQNGCREPHRDTRNLGNNLVVALTAHEGGGGLWVADSEGTVIQLHQGTRVPGIIQSLDAPFQFSARTRLHATQPWSESRRVVLVAFTPLGSLNLQSTGYPEHKSKQSRIQDYFHTCNHVD